MKKISKIIGFIILALIILSSFVFLWKKAQPKKLYYTIEKPVIDTLEKKTVATGKVEPRDEVLIKPQISGIVEEVYKQAGEVVKSGDIIAKIKVIPEMSSLSNADSRVNQAEISLNQISAEYARQKQLFGNGVISKEEFEKSEANYKKAKEDLDNAKDNYNIIQSGISKKGNAYSTTQIRATVSGMILDVPVKVGNSVIQSNNFNDGTTIASIANMNDIIFRGNIDETDVGRIKEGMPMQITLGAIQGKTFKAMLEYISPKGKEENGANLFEIKAAVEIPDTVFVRAGYSANAEIVLQRKEKVLTIPESTIEFSKDTAFVYLLTSGDAAEQKFDKKKIKVGLSDGIRIEVVSGLNQKDQLRGNVIDKKNE
ncbi:MAG: efflux RND transporter periplasmic adaptor subunit [Bacteroidales bacterium]